MLQISIVLFREFLEISILIGIIAAATKSIKNSGIYITAGLMSGIICAAILSFFITRLTFSFSGYGEELFDVGIIFLTVFVVSATAIWVRNYSSVLNSKLDDISNNIERGIMSKLMLITVVASTIFREVTEVALFVHALSSAYELSPVDYLLGFGIGMFMGVTCGICIYLGLNRIGVKYLFRVSFILLALVAASLASEAAGILTSCGIIDIYSEALWDSGWIVSDASIAGRMLKILVGYNSQPNLMQVVFYLSTLFLIYISAKLGERRKNVKVVS